MPEKKPPVSIDLSGLVKKEVTNPRLKERAGDGRRAWKRMEKDQAAGLMDFTRLPGRRGLAKKSVDLATKLRPGTEDVILCGIGGSALGFRALAGALLHPLHNQLPKRRRGGPRVHVLDNADADTAAAVLDVVNLDRCLLVVVSKTGGGGESIANFLVVLEQLVKRRKGDLKKALRQVVVVTDPKQGPLRRFARTHGVASLAIPTNVGGRFSVLSPVGIFPAALAGIDVDGLLSGAKAMHARLAERGPLSNPAMKLALLLDLHYRAGRKITVFMPYADALWRLADWFRQLWAESLGKATTRDGEEVHHGLTPMAALGATDQHSQVQLYAEGPDDKTYIFLRTRSNAAVTIPEPRFEKDAYGFLGGHTLDELLNLEGNATQAALAHFGRPTARITMPGTTPHAVGQVPKTGLLAKDLVRPGFSKK